MKPLAATGKMADATMSAQNTSTIPTALGPQLEDSRRVATAREAPTVVVVAPEVVAAVAVVVAAAAEGHLTASAEELVVATIVEAEATRTATPPATHVAAMTLTIGSTRSATKRLLKQATTTAFPPILQDFATCSFLRNSNLSGSPSTTRSKTQYSGQVLRLGH
jgi:hypothetical protein